MDEKENISLILALVLVAGTETCIYGDCVLVMYGYEQGCGMVSCNKRK